MTNLYARTIGIITTFVQIPILIMIKVHSRNFIIAMQSQTSTILSI